MLQSYEEFEAWYGQKIQSIFDPALTLAIARTGNLLDNSLLESERSRVRIGSRRIKLPNRAWEKIGQKYGGKIHTLGDIAIYVDDIVAFRLICQNLSDVQRVLGILSELPTEPTADRAQLFVYDTSHKDYISEPRPSGYRAHHVNLGVQIEHHGGWVPVTVEVQIRTLLQDSWGELTHEDTYRPRTPVAPLVNNLSLRLADLLSTLDDIADDLRQVLDGTLESVELATSAETEFRELSVTDQGLQGKVRDFLATRYQALSEPLDLASLAWATQKEFGAEITSSWAGYGNFRSLVRAAIPDAIITNTPPSYLLPVGFDATQHHLSRFVPGLISQPVALSQLKTIDRSFPVLTREDWQDLYSELAAATHEVSSPLQVDVRYVYALTRTARNQGKAKISRNAFHYVAMGLLFAGVLGESMDKDTVRSEFINWMSRRMSELGIYDEHGWERVRGWLGGATEESEEFASNS